MSTRTPTTTVEGSTMLTMRDRSNNNTMLPLPLLLPASFDATSLLSKLERLEGRRKDPSVGGGTSTSTTTEDDDYSLIKRTRLIEVDPYYYYYDGDDGDDGDRNNEETKKKKKKTRLFVAIAFGKRHVVARLIALELGNVPLLDYIDDDDATSGSCSAGGGDDGGGGETHEVEWIDAYSTADGDGGGGGDDPAVVIFPPSHAEPLPQQGRNDENNNNDDGDVVSSASLIASADDDDDDGDDIGIITSCALIPSPTVMVRISEEEEEEEHSRSVVVSRRRTVAVIIGTDRDRVLSVPLDVIRLLPGDDDDDGNNVRFGLEYRERGRRGGGDRSKVRGGEKSGGSGTGRYPVAYQMLPRAKRLSYGRRGNSEGEEEEEDGGLFHNNNNDNNNHAGDGNVVEVYRPSVRASSPQSESHPPDGGEEEGCSGIESITFFRENPSFSGRRRAAATTTTGKGGGGGGGTREAIASRDAIWIVYGNGALTKLPSWRPFLLPNSAGGGGGGGGGGGDISDLVGGSGAVIVGGGRDKSTVIPLGAPPFRSPLDVPPPPPPPPIIAHDAVTTGDEVTTTAARGGPNDVDDDDDYWDLLSSAVGIGGSSSSSSSRANNPRDDDDPPARALVLAGPSALPSSTLPMAFVSSRIACDPSSRRAGRGGGGSSEADSSDYGSARGETTENTTTDDDDGPYGPVTGMVVEGTAALVKGALGAAFGAVRWGLGGGGGGAAGVGVGEEEADSSGDEFMEADEKIDEDSVDHAGVPPQQQLGRGGQVKDLFPWPMSGASFSYSDSPRRFETAKVDPSGSFVATTDNLGRVILFDLETNQPIRMFKGMRNVSCHFAELPCHDGRNKTRSYLVIHLRQRGAVEVYRLPQGPRLSAMAVPQQKDCSVIECYGPPSEGNRVDTFLLERIDEADGNGREGCQYVIDKLIIDDPDAMATSFANQSPARPKSQSENRMQLKLLLQLLAPDTNIQCNSQTVLATFKSIRALSDLGEGLDALSKSNRLESEMGIDGSSLHSQAASYCKDRLNQAKQQETQEGSGMVRKAAIAELKLKLAYHERLDRAYTVLHRYESKNFGDDQDHGQRNNLSPWTSEALSWVSASFSQSKRFMPSFYDDATNQDENKPLEFSKFALACQPSNGDDDRVYLTKVKRGRVPILRRFFRPLRQDLFVFKVVNSLFGRLGIDQDFDIQQQYFGEWISTLSYDILKSNICGTYRLMNRWLQDLIISAYDASIRGQQKLGDELLRKICKLDFLLKFCSEMEDLPKAFLLAVICMDAVSSATVQLEHKTYGKITQLESVQPWEDLTRKLRVCLLVTLRLEGDVNPIGGTNPMTVKSVSRSDIFSAFAWIARDELLLSHENQVLVALESACQRSSESFYPSTADGDSVEHKRTMFQSCGSSRQGSSILHPTGLTNETRQCRPLLFYFKDHARFTTHLAANRALILASLWGQAPDQLHLLKHTISSLQIVVDHIERFSLATLVEIYQSRIRPVCRAMLFGFGEHELSEDVVSPLLGNPVWLHEFITVTKRILAMIIECMSKMPPSTSINNDESSDMWPPLRECPVLGALVKKLRVVELSSVELHHTAVFAFQMTRDIDSLQSVVPSFSSLFLLGTLAVSMPPMPKGSTEQKSLLDKAIVDHAEKTSVPVVDNFYRIKDVELFGNALGLDVKYIRTHYLVEMIRLGKDASINDLLGASSSSLDKPVFAEEVVQITCSRLDATIAMLKQTKKYRGVLSLLDADASRWVREEAAKCSPSEQNNYAKASLINTHSLVMRARNLYENVDDSLSERIDALCLMSGTLLKAVQAHEQDTIMNV